MEILKLENGINEIESSVDEFNSRIEGQRKELVNWKTAQ